MAQIGGEMHDDVQKSKYFAGPLNLCRETKQADTVLGAEFILDENEFDALDMLAMHEGQALSFEQLFEAVWKTPDNADNRAAAHAKLNVLMEKINTAGEGFMRIDCSPEKGYTFQTHWGHNWGKKQPLVETYVRPADEMTAPDEPQVRKRRPSSILLGGLGAAAAVIALVVTAIFSSPAGDAYIIEDGGVPLAAWESDTDIICSELAALPEAGECAEAGDEGNLEQ